MWISDSPLNFVEAVEFLRTISAFRQEYQGELPKLQVYNAESEGYVIWVKTNSVNAEFRSFLRQVVRTRGLRIRKRDEYLVIHSV
jgi:hypothetical protein